jgi:hypothetical protein
MVCFSTSNINTIDTIKLKLSPDYSFVLYRYLNKLIIILHYAKIRENPLIFKIFWGWYVKILTIPYRAGVGGWSEKGQKHTYVI